MTIEYVDFDRAVAKEMWSQVSMELTCFTPIRALREDVAIIATVDIDAAYELTDTCAVNIVVLGCELQVDLEHKQLNLQAGLNISPELRAVLTVMISRKLSSEISDAIEKCAQWIEATEEAPDGFIGEQYPPATAEAESDELIEETSEGDPFEHDTGELNVAEVTPESTDDNPY
jgi:hypothetical protein